MQVATSTTWCLGEACQINTLVCSPKTARWGGGAAAGWLSDVQPCLVCSVPLEVSTSAQVVMPGCCPCCTCCASCWVFFLRSSCPWAPSQLERYTAGGAGGAGGAGRQQGRAGQGSSMDGVGVGFWGLGSQP